MKIPIKQQVTATYARNHFKEVNDRAIQEGEVFIVRKSAPATVIIPIEKYHRLMAKVAPEPAEPSPATAKKKITLEELRKNSYFEKYVGCLQDERPELNSIEFAKTWTDYVD